MRTFVRDLALLVLLCVPAAAAAADNPVRAYRMAHEREILDEFSRMLALPNVASNVADIERNAAFIVAALERRGLAARILSAGPGTPPSVYAELNSPGATRTIIFYAHYDGQPASGQRGWLSDPWTPVMRSGPLGAQTRDIDWRAAPSIDPEWRLYARSASDDKVAVQAMLSALDALRAQGRRPRVNIKLFLEGEEEAGSTHLPAILQRHASLLSGDLFVLGDGPRHQSGQMQLIFGARGVSTVDLTVYGPLRPLHDGHYGNWAPNPAASLTHLLASMRDEEGRILIPGFYDDVTAPTAAETAALAALPDVETQLRRELALGRTEGDERLAESLARPALNLRGIRVGDVGAAASNTIYPEAQASIDFRLVPAQTPQRVRDRTEAFLRAQGWHVTHEAPTPALRAAHPKLVRADWRLDYGPYRTRTDSPEASALARAIERATGAPPLLVPTTGGSVPMEIFGTALGMPIIIVPLANYDNNQHGPNENLRLRNLWDGIEIYASLLTSLDW
jgi:acetylornithine deacetylase/succinyl-diaminopimelate desuccinylase-like protein